VRFAALARNCDEADGVADNSEIPPSPSSEDHDTACRVEYHAVVRLCRVGAVTGMILIVLASLSDGLRDCSSHADTSC
jgi:hypothetical protein